MTRWYGQVVIEPKWFNAESQLLWTQLVREHEVQGGFPRVGRTSVTCCSPDFDPCTGGFDIHFPTDLAIKITISNMLHVACKCVVKYVQTCDLIHAQYIFHAISWSQYIFAQLDVVQQHLHTKLFHVFNHCWNKAVYKHKSCSHIALIAWTRRRQG
jgi:hypothetical protein